MVFDFLQFSQWFIRMYPHSFISPLRINVSAIESIFSVLKFTAGENLSLQATLDLFVEVITGQEVITNSNSECRHHDGIILVSESFTSNSRASRTSYSAWLVYDLFGLSRLKQFCFSANLSQSTIGGCQGSNAYTVIASSLGYQFVKLALPELTLSTLPSQWSEVIVNSMLCMTFSLMQRPEILTLKMPVECCRNDLHTCH